MRKVVLFILLVCAFSQVAFAQAPADGSIDQAAQKSLTDKVDKLFGQWDKADSPGCAVGVIRNGQFVYKRGYGMANLEYNIPISPTSIFWDCVHVETVHGDEHRCWKSMVRYISCRNAAHL